jgi:hypothetical protein
MKKFVNHVDHAVWISRPENLEANVAMLKDFMPNRAIVGGPDDCIREMRLFAKHVMPVFHQQEETQT